VISIDRCKIGNREQKDIPSVFCSDLNCVDMFVTP